MPCVLSRTQSIKVWALLKFHPLLGKAAREYEKGRTHSQFSSSFAPGNFITRSLLLRLDWKTERVSSSTPKVSPTGLRTQGQWYSANNCS